MTVDSESILSWRGQELVDRDGDKVGKIEEIYADEHTGRPEWALVGMGLFGGRSTFVPIAEAHPTDGGVRVPYEKDHVKSAPRMDPDGELSQEEEQSLYRHYGLEYSESRSETGLPEPPASDTAPRDPEPVGRDVSGPTTDEAMTRSEEEVAIGTTEREAGRARLRKYVVTEHVTQTVPVRREEVRLEREPITEANAPEALDGPPISEEEHELVLHEEQPVVEKRVVPKERVRLGKETVEEQQQVSEQVRKEQIDVEGEQTP